MKTLSILLVFLIFFNLLSCKKENKPQPPSTISIAGKWKIKSYTISETRNGIAQAPISLLTDTTEFIQFNNDGTGTEWNGDPNYYPGPFKFQIVNSKLILAGKYKFLDAGEYTLNIPASNTLILRGEYTSVLAGINLTTAEEINLNK